ncbi:hypothetical protein MTP04_02500 [Lysinibacillus sp. PLM2]|nr:hypothetical protein MTP04_02500 [Lysinibacillus sp. PLM2]
MNYKVFSVGPDWVEFIAAQTAEEALAEHLRRADYKEHELQDITVNEIPFETEYRFENEQGTFDEMTFGEWLKDFEYKKPKLLCWQE